MMTRHARRMERARKKVPKWIRDAVEYWGSRVYEGDLGCDFSEADVHCWRCGCMRACQKCHIVPQSLGGTDDVSNLIPLCAQCHDEMPNVSDPKEVWRWIAADHGTLYDLYWATKAREQAGLTPEQEAAIDLQKVAKLLRHHASPHFGQLYGRARTSTATLAWVLRMAAKEAS